MDFTAPSFSLGLDSDDDDPAPPGGTGPREQPRGYTAPDMPPFSLGIDLDDDDAEEEPRAPAGGRREEQARVSAAPDPPSFSLAFDDDDAEEEARAPAGSRREEQARVSAVPDPPPFSLRFDDDDGGVLAGSPRHEQTRPQVARRVPLSPCAEDEEDDFVLVGGGEPPPQETNRFKRLRKGPAPTPQARRCEAPDAPSSSFSMGISDDDREAFIAGDRHHKQSRPPRPRTPSSLSFEDDDDAFVIAGDRRPEPTRSDLTPLGLRKRTTLPHLAPAPPPRKVSGSPVPQASPVMSENAALGAIGTGSLEDEIEDWTTDEDRPVRDVPPSVGSCSSSSNQKFSLLNRGVLTTQSATKTKTPKFTETSNFSASKSLEESCTKKLLPNITISPMRKIHMLDSDTDADDDQNQNKAKKPVSPMKRRQESMHKYTQEKPTLQQNSKPQVSTIVQRSEAMMNDNWATPALDEFCNEYFKSTKDAGSSQQRESNSFCYSKGSQSKYCIGDVERHFQGQSTSSGVVLDDILDSRPPAMHYFFHHDPRVRDLVRARLQYFFPIGAESTRENEQNKGESFSYRREFTSSTTANNDWVTPNRRVSVPTDVGKRRVHASGSQSGSGHWFTSDNGKKVYVSKSGQELTGRDAYRQYKKESGRGFSRYKKKGSSGTKRGATKVKVETVAKQGTSRSKRKR